MNDNPHYQELHLGESEPPSLEEQLEYWQERYFRELDAKADLINQLQAIRRILDGKSDES